MNDPQTEINGLTDYSYMFPFVGNNDQLTTKAFGTMITGHLKSINEILHVCDYQYLTITRKENGFYVNFIFDVPCFIENRFEALEAAHFEAGNIIDELMDELINILETE